MFIYFDHKNYIYLHVRNDVILYHVDYVAIIVANPFNFVRSGRVVFQSLTISIQSRRVHGLESVAPVQDKSIRSQLKQKTINYSKGALIGPWSRQHTVYHFMHSEMPIVNNNECYLRLSGHFLKLFVSGCVEQVGQNSTRVTTNLA